MNLLANAAEDNEAYEHQLTHAQLQQLQQHLFQQQLQQQVTPLSYLLAAELCCQYAGMSGCVNRGSCASVN